MNMVFTFLYSFKAKLDHLPYLDNDCEKIIKKKVEILKVDQSEPVVNQQSGHIFIKPILVISHHLKTLHVTTKSNSVLVQSVMVENGHNKDTMIPSQVVISYFIKGIIQSMVDGYNCQVQDIYCIFLCSKSKDRME